MQTKKLISKLEISGILATIIDITDLIPAKPEPAKKLFNGLVYYAIAQLNKNNYSITAAKTLCELSGVKITKAKQIYNSPTLTKHYTSKGLAALLIETKQYNVTHSQANLYQYEIDRLICNKYQVAKQLENNKTLAEIEEILLV